MNRSRVSYLALWGIGVVMIVAGIVTASISTVTQSELIEGTTYSVRDVYVGGWGIGLLVAGALIVTVLLFLDAYRGGPRYTREGGARRD